MKEEITYFRKFETTILRTASMIAVAIMIIQVYRDLTVAYHRLDFIIDLSILLIVVTLLALTYTRVNLNLYLVPFCFLIALVMPITWVSSGGLDSNNEYQMFGAIFFFTLVLSGRWLVFFATLMISMEVGLIYTWNNHIDIFAPLLREPSMESIHFILIAIAVTVGVLYFKNKLCSKRQELNEQREVLALKLQKLSNQTLLIRKQKKELEIINRNLEKKVKNRSEELNQKNMHLSQFLDLSLKGINEPLDSILESISEITDIDKEHDLIRLLSESGIELEKSVMVVTNRLENGVAELNGQKNEK